MHQIPKPDLLDLHLSISNGFVSSLIYDKRDDLFTFLYSGLPRSSSRGLQFSLYSVARVINHVADFDVRNKILTA